MTETAIETAPGTPAPRTRLPLLLAKYGTLVGLALMVAVFSALAPVAFPTVSNLINVLKTKYFGNISTQINAAGNPNFAVGSPRTFLGTLNIGF